MQQSCKALIKFKQCRVLSHKYGMKQLSGRALICLGELYEKYPSKQDQARQCFQEANQCFYETSSMDLKKFSMYALARLTAKAFFPKLIRTIKSTACNRCALLRLYQWKNCLRPLQRNARGQAYFLAHDDLPECGYISYENLTDDLDATFSCEDVSVAAEDIAEDRISIPDEASIEYASHFIVRQRLPQKIGNTL